MNDPIQPNTCAELLGALAAPERLRVIRLPRNGERNVGEIGAQLEMLPVNLAHHVSVLRDAGLVESEKRDRFVYYSLAPGVLEPEGQSSLIDHLNLGRCRIELPKPGK